MAKNQRLYHIQSIDMGIDTYTTEEARIVEIIRNAREGQRIHIEIRTLSDKGEK